MDSYDTYFLVAVAFVLLASFKNSNADVFRPYFDSELACREISHLVTSDLGFELSKLFTPRARRATSSSSAMIIARTYTRTTVPALMYVQSVIYRKRKKNYTRHGAKKKQAPHAIKRANSKEVRRVGRKRKDGDLIGVDE